MSANNWWVLDMLSELMKSIEQGDTLTYSEENELGKIRDKVDEDIPLSDADVQFIEKQHRKYC